MLNFKHEQSFGCSSQPDLLHDTVNYGLIIYILIKQHTSSTKVDALHSILSEKLSLENI